MTTESSPKKIVICGSHGVGKTTLTNILQKILGYHKIDEVARTIIPFYGYKDTNAFVEDSVKNKGMVNILQISIFYKQMELEKSHPYFVSDRSIFDNIAYAKLYGVHKDILDNMERIAYLHAMDTYDLVIYIHPTIPIVDDGFRLTDDKTRNEIDAIMVNYVKELEQMGMDVLHIEETDFSERLQKVINHLAKRG